MISNLAYINKNLYILNQLKFKSKYLLSSPKAIDLHIKSLCYRVNILTSIKSIIGLIILIKVTFG